MKNDAPKSRLNTWFDRELAWLVGLFGLLWIIVGGGGMYFYSAIACLQFYQSDPRYVCARATDLPLLPASLKSSARIKLIEAHINQSEYDAALTVIADVEKFTGGSAWLFEKKGSSLRNVGRTEEAALAYREVLTFEPSNESAADTLVSIELENKNFEGARQAAADYVSKNPTSVSMMSWQGWVEHRAGDNGLALSFYARAMVLEPENATLYRDVADIKLAMGNPAEAINSISKAITLSPDNSYYFNKRAEIYDSLGDLALSQADYEKSLALDRSSSTLVTLGRSYTDSGDYVKALDVLNEAVAQDYDIEWAKSSKIRLHIFEGKLTEAKSELAELLKSNPTGADGLYWKGAIANHEGRYEDALNDFQNMVTEYPNYSDARLELGQTLIDLNRPAESIPHFTQVIANWAQSDVAFTARARGNYALENWWAALSDANQSIKLKPKQGRAYGYRAAALAKLGRLEEAKVSFAVATKYDPKIEWVQRDYFNVLLAENDVEGAKGVLNSLRANVPNSKHLSEFETTLAARGVKLP